MDTSVHGGTRCKLQLLSLVLSPRPWLPRTISSLFSRSVSIRGCFSDRLFGVLTSPTYLDGMWIFPSMGWCWRDYGFVICLNDHSLTRQAGTSWETEVTRNGGTSINDCIQGLKNPHPHHTMFQPTLIHVLLSFVQHLTPTVKTSISLLTFPLIPLSYVEQLPLSTRCVCQYSGRSREWFRDAAGPSFNDRRWNHPSLSFQVVLDTSNISAPSCSSPWNHSQRL